MLNVIDISDYQSNINITNLGSALAGVICKATESTTYVSPVFENQWKQTQNAKKLLGAYHFAGSSIHKKIGNAHDEAVFFAKGIEAVKGRAVLMLDWEPYGYGMTTTEEMQWVLSFQQELHAITGIWHIIYMDFNHVRTWHATNPTLAAEVAAHSALMVAGGIYYNRVSGFDAPTFPGGLPSYWHLFGWQYTSRGDLNGYKPIDLNAVYVTEAQWATWAGQTATPPVIVPTSPMHGHGVPSLIAEGNGHYFGSITGPADSLGGAHPDERPYIKLIQQQLIHLGYVPGNNNVNSDWADGIFDTLQDNPGTGPTSRAVATFQRAHMPGTKFFGQVWYDDWTKLASL